MLERQEAGHCGHLSQALATYRLGGGHEARRFPRDARRPFRHIRVGSAITESTANAQNTTAR